MHVPIYLYWLCNIFIFSSLSDSRPADLHMIMPPSISGLVFNQAKQEGSNSYTHSHPKAGGKYFDVRSLLKRWPDLFKVYTRRRGSSNQKKCVLMKSNVFFSISQLGPDKPCEGNNGTKEDDHQQVEYLSRIGKEDAVNKLREILVEGLFVYFFAKFCHGPVFK